VSGKAAGKFVWQDGDVEIQPVSSGMAPDDGRKDKDLPQPEQQKRAAGRAGQRREQKRASAAKSGGKPTQKSGKQPPKGAPKKS
jgi:hypothetical protein